jgi:CelD/BcsL family acetyltransferase involved in cellulose biosynthesis
VLATALGLHHLGVYYLLLPAFANGSMARHSPGNLLLFLQMQDLRADGGHAYDFTIGDEAYKARFGAARSPLLCAYLPRTLRGQASAKMETARVLWRRRDELSAAAKSMMKSGAKYHWFKVLALAAAAWVYVDA